MKDLNVDDMVTVKLPGEGVYEPDYKGERFLDGVDDFFTAVTEDRVAAFLLDHPTCVNMN